MAKGRGPSAESLKDQFEHSYEHRGESGMFGNYFTVDVNEWSPADEENEVGIVPFLLKVNSDFRKKNPELNRPVSDSQLKSNNGWVHKLSVFSHGNIGPNKDNKICLKTLKERCPVCELRDEFREKLAKLKAKGRTDQELVDRISQLNPRKRAIYNMISFNSTKDKERGLMVWAAPHASIEDEIIDRAKDKRTAEYKMFAVLEDNWNIFFRKTGKGLNTEYSEVDVLDRRKEDILSEEEMDRLLEDALVIDEIVEVLSYDELYELLHGVKPGEKLPEQKPDPQEEEEPRSRRGSREESEERPRERERSTRKSEERGERRQEPVKGEQDNPECFALEFNQKNECEDCASDVFKACMKASDDAVKKERGVERGSEDKDKRSAAKEDRTSRKR